jgi:hypothetical protein
VGAIGVPRKFPADVFHEPSYCQPLLVNEPVGALVLKEGSPVSLNNTARLLAAGSAKAKKTTKTRALTPESFIWNGANLMVNRHQSKAEGICGRNQK